MDNSMPDCSQSDCNTSHDGHRINQQSNVGYRHGSSDDEQWRGSQQSTQESAPSCRGFAQLKRSQNAYVPRIFQRRVRVNLEEESEEERLRRETNLQLRTIVSLVNKLTSQNSNFILLRVKESGILYNADGLSIMAVTIFKTAVITPQCSASLAELVENIINELDNDGASNHRAFFKTSLLTQCQQMFDTDLGVLVATEEDRMNKKMENEKDPQIKEMFFKEIDEAKFKVLAKFNGNIKFVGELYLLGVLGAKTIHNCIAMLLQGRDEESIESACIFLETTGTKLDRGLAVKRIDAYFQRIANIRVVVESQRLNFKLDDLLDLRNRKWKPREREAKIQGTPKGSQTVQSTNGATDAQTLISSTPDSSDDKAPSCSLVPQQSQGYHSKEEDLDVNLSVASNELGMGVSHERQPLEEKVCLLMENKARHIFSQYFIHKEFDERAFESVKSRGDAFVDNLVKHVMEKSKIARIDAGNLIAMLIDKGHLRPDDVSEGLKPTLEAAADLLLDVPRLYSYIAEILSGCICVEVLALLPSTLTSLEQKHERANIVSEMLHLASEAHGHDKVGSMFQTAGIDWCMFLSPSQNCEEFVKANKLEYTAAGGAKLTKAV